MSDSTSGCPSPLESSRFTNRYRQRSADVRRACLIAALVFVSCAYFYGGGGWNQDSRFDLVRAIVEQRTLSIDRYHVNTGDKAFFRGHYYSDKAPGTALLAVPFVALGRVILQWAGWDPESPSSVLALSYVANVCVIAAPSAIAASILFLLALRLGSTYGGATFSAISMSLATPVWAFSTVFFGHVLAGACLLLAFALAFELRDSKSDTRRDLFLGFAIGFAAGWATVTEYPAAPASVALALLTLSQVWRDGWSRRGRIALGVAGGGLVCLAVLLSYQYAAFGSLLSVTYSHYQPGQFPVMDTGFHGLTYPRIGIMASLLISPHLGLLLLAPILFFAPFGLFLLWKQGSARAFALGAAILAAYYWLFNASFVAWDGGWGYGPRYMVAAIPVLCIGLAPFWSRASVGLRVCLAVLAICGISFSLIAVSTTVMQPEYYQWPLFQLNWRAFWSGRLGITCEELLRPPGTVDPAHAAFNLGQLIGLRGLTSLAPLFGLWLACAILWIRVGSGSRKKAPESAKK